MGSSFLPVRDMPACLDRKYSFNVDSWGNIRCWNEKGRVVAELDGLWEYRNDASLIPIILEISYQRETSLNERMKYGLISRLYSGTNPYLTEIRPLWRNQKIGLSGIKPSFQRKIIIPNRGEFCQLAEELFEEHN